MLQYSVQLPPLSITSSKPRNRSRAASSKQLSAQAAAAHGSAPKRTDVRSPTYTHSSVPLPLQTAYPSSPSISSGSPSLPPTPSLPSAYPFPQTSSPLATPLMTSKPIPRSPYIPSASLAVNVPSTRSPYPSKPIPLPSSGLSSPTLPNVDSHFRSTSSTPSSFSSSVLDILSPGDLIGEGMKLQGEAVRCVPITPLRAPDLAPSPQEPATPSQPSSTIAGPSTDEPARTFEVVKKLGTGSYAVVYLVREVLYRAPEESNDQYEDDGADLDMSMDGHSDSEGDRYGKVVRENEYGREYAVKLLSKANLDAEALEAQVLEAQIHQSLPKHPNIVSLHRVLDTPAFLLLVLEFVPGEDLFYFLEQARDHYEPSTSPILEAQSPPTSESDCSLASIDSSRTPPTPSLLSSLSPSKLLSRKRLKLIASMFSQMCDAVATCHERGVFHRDIKPENFIVTDGMMEVREPRVFGEGDDMTEEIVLRRERKVVVKLTDFGLSTTEMHSGDMDCGSAPYMSFECRNNVHTTYMPRAADVWSLGIVLINMLYHHNPWTDAALQVCPSFSAFRQSPTHFFLSRFSGMTPAVAEFLATRVFCLLPDPMDDSPRVSARQFGAWVRDLPDLLAPKPSPTLASRPGSAGHVRTSSITIVNMAEIHGHRLSSIPHSRRPSLRSAAGSRNPSLLANQRTSWALSRAPSLGPALEEPERLFPGAANGVGLGVLPAVIDHEGDDEHEHDDQEPEQEQEQEHEPESVSGSRSASQAKRRKRGARKGKGAAAASASALPSTPLPAAQDQNIENLVSALARELSRTSRSGSVSSPLAASGSPVTPVAVAAAAPLPPAPATVAPTITKKPSKWKLGFGKSSSNSSSAAKESAPATPTQVSSATTVNNVSNLIMGLDAPNKPAASTARQHSPYLQQNPPPSSSSFASSNTHSRYAPSQNSSVVSLDDPNWARGRRNRPSRLTDPGDGMWGASTVSAFANTSRQPTSNLALPSSSSLSPSALARQRGVSPASASQVSVMSASTASSNWRSSMSSASSAATSSSAFTRYSNGSARSISTTATSVSGTSWRSANSKPAAPVGQTVRANGREVRLPANVKFMEGHSWELSEVPRGQYIDPESMTFSSPPQRKRAQKPKNASNLDTISERPIPSSSGAASRPEASLSNTDLNSGASDDGEGSPGSPRKVQKGQINALAKMLSALRR